MRPLAVGKSFCKVGLRTTVTALPHFAPNCACAAASRVRAKKLPCIALY